MGDLNGHHLWWQGPLPSTARISYRCQMIAYWLEDNNFHLQNEPAISTNHPKNGGRPFTIDLCFSQGSTTQSILMLVVDHNTTSDHSAKVSMALSLPTVTIPVARRPCWHRANWETLDSQIQSAKMDLLQLHGKDDTLHAVTIITHLIHQAGDEAVPVKTPWKTDTPWWNHSLMLAKQSVKRANQCAHLQPTVMNLNHSQCKRSKWSTMVQNTKTA